LREEPAPEEKDAKSRKKGSRTRTQNRVLNKKKTLREGKKRGEKYNLSGISFPEVRPRRKEEEEKRDHEGCGILFDGKPP